MDHQEAQTETRYCEACAHFRPSADHIGKSTIRFGKCLKARDAGSLGLELVSPALLDQITYSYASCTRVDSRACGPEGKWFEPKLDTPVSEAA